MRLGAQRRLGYEPLGVSTIRGQYLGAQREPLLGIWGHLGLETRAL